ncbi:uncharacterized protein LOC116619449 [Nematostella vectensis]|uniref:uncharacterized protein LOC116619449 n=1 Tax=Nematostella vectensis TaxID=45351 RepID=UPI00138FC904|nr:uncharacterized protein LOC116619449 [Nematostella vectensis]XP_048584946.1 uncharacterized protein LOC116619449 [Nematostella vectensis]
MTRVLAWLILLKVLQVSTGGLVVIHASSETKEYWVPREHVTLGVQDSDTVGYLIDQLCYIFHRSRKMAQHKENYPCQSRSKALMLYNPDSKAEYRDTEFSLGFYKITNGTRLYLYYS